MNAFERFAACSPAIQQGGNLLYGKPSRLATIGALVVFAVLKLLPRAAVHRVTFRHQQVFASREPHNPAGKWVDQRGSFMSSPKVPQPKAARYAWQSNPNATLFNGAGLPAGPFRTDDWPGVTDKQE